MANFFNWNAGVTTGNFGVASSWDPAEPGNIAGPPTSADTAEIGVAANISGTGTANQLNIDAAVTINSALTTTIEQFTIIANSANASVTLTSTWDDDPGTITIGQFSGGTGTLNIDAGGSLTSGGANIGLFSGATGIVNVTGAGAQWTATGINVGNGGGVGTLSVQNGGSVQAAQYLGISQGSTITVGAQGALEVGTAGGAAAGFLTIDNGSNFYGDGVVNAKIVDNGGIFASDGSLTLNGAITGDSYVTVGEQATLTLDQSVASTIPGVNFYGWYGKLVLKDTAGLQAPIGNFIPTDTIDLANLAFNSASSSYAYNPDSGDLQITEGSTVVNLTVYSPGNLQGQLTLSKDAGGGTQIQYTSAPSGPFQLWSTLSSNFFSTSGGSVNGDNWDLSNVTDGGAPIWVDDETSAAGFVQGHAATYNIDLTTQDWLGDEQSLVPVATTTLINPFGNLAAATIFSSNNSGGSGAVLYWQASATAGDYDLEFRPLQTNYLAAPSAGPNTTLTGPAVAMETAVASPTSWTFNNNSSSLVFGYTTAVSSTTEDIWFQAFNTSGVATSPLTEVATNVADGTQYFVGYSNGTFYYRYTVINGSATGLYGGTFNTATGALVSQGELTALPSFTSFSGIASRNLSDGDSLRFYEGVEGGKDVIQAYLDSSATTTFNLSASTDQFATANVTDPNDGADDYTVVAYTDKNQVHLELLNENGVQIGSDFIVPGITSFDRIHTLTGSSESSDTRVEIDYTVANPAGGQEVLGYIFDTNGIPDYYTLGSAGSNEYNGTPFDDTIFDNTGGPYFVDGGGGSDTFVVNDDALQVTIGADSSGDLIVTTPGNSTATLRRFTTISLQDATYTIAGKTLTLSPGALLQLTAPISGETFAFTGGGKINLESGSNAGTVLGFGLGDSIDFDGVSYAAGDHVVLVSNGAQTGRTVLIENSGGATIASFIVNGDYQPSQFSLANDGNGDLLVEGSGRSYTAPSDFTGGGVSDVVLRNGSGSFVDWTMNGPAVTASTLLTSGGAAVSPLLRLDCRWRRRPQQPTARPTSCCAIRNGTFADWTMNGAQITTSQLLTSQGATVTLGSAWTVDGLGDFNGDGDADVLLRNTNGTLADWTMNGSQIASSQLLSSQGATVTLGSAWSVAGVGDFNGDGLADILLRNSNGAFADWTMNGSKIASSQLLTSGGATVTLGAAWSVAGVGDFNGDGLADVLLRNSNGTLADWTMNGSQIESSQLLTSGGKTVTLDPSWSIAALGDFTGDGKTDILLQNTSGAFVEWTMNGSTITAATAVTAAGKPVSTSAWHAQGSPTDLPFG